MRDGRALSTRQGRQEAAVRVFLTAWCLSGTSSWDSQLGWGHVGVPAVGIAQRGALGGSGTWAEELESTSTCVW